MDLTRSRRGCWKYTTTSITPSVTKLFNQSIVQAQIPTPVEKVCDSICPKIFWCIHTPTNYQPILLLPLLSKFLERHIYELILHHLQSNDVGILGGKVHHNGFDKMHRWLAQKFGGWKWYNILCVVFFDYCSPPSCDSEALGLDDCIINWLRNYQVVAVDGVESDPLPVLSGVPWRSVFGPLLFLIYQQPSKCPRYVVPPNLFTDDVLLYRIITCVADYHLLQELICRIEQWSTKNYLDFNTSKCIYMIVLRKRNPPVPDVPLHLFGSTLERVDCYKYLGVLLTDDLSWSMHAETVCQKVRRVLGLLYRRFYGHASQESLKQLYLSLVLPHLEYACQVWDPHLSKDINALEKVQKFACKLATAKWDCSYEELLGLMQLKSLQNRRLDSKLGLVFKLVHNLCYFLDNSWSFRSN